MIELEGSRRVYNRRAYEQCQRRGFKAIRTIDHEPWCCNVQKWIMISPDYVLFFNNLIDLN